MLYRHGDVLLARVPQLPHTAQPKPDVILARGEVTVHSHRILETHSAQMYNFNADTYLEIRAPKATLVHEEHRAITLEQGVYKVWMQREYRPDANRWVKD
jgi:hypothetical protein